MSDDEVAADLALRASTERRRDSSVVAYGPGRIVGQVPCRGRCGSLADWTDEAEAAFRAFSAALEARGEAELDKTRAVFCSACRERGKSLVAEANRQRVDRLAELIREIKICRDPRREVELVEAIRSAGHPDVDGLVEAMRAKRAEAGKPRAWRGDL